MSIAEYIQEDLKAKLMTGHPLPEPLTLRSLARHYEVSITPVRIATEALIRQQHFKRDKEGRLHATPLSDPTLPMPHHPPSEPVDWDAVLQQEAVRLSLAGKEVFWREQAAADQHGIGRTRLRRIFSRMAGLGFLEHVPRRGWRVRPFDQKQMCDYLEIRETMEIKAMRLAQPRLDRALLKRILDGNIPARNGQPAQLDNRLHQHWIEQSQNAYIQDFFIRHSGFYTTLFDYAAPGASRVDEMVYQHRQILQAILVENWASARKHLSEHIRDQKPVVIKLLEALHKKSASSG